MIRIRIEPDAITAEGHAGFAMRGHDIVCAAVSALMYTLIYNIELAQGAAQVEEREGYMRIEIPKDDPCAGAYAVIANGLCMISEQYSEYVKAEIVE